MKIGEVETRLNLSRSNIRFYERQGLLKPARRENRYRDYDEEDIRCLKRIIILRKCGVPVADIQSMMEGGRSMDTVLEQQVKTLEEQLKEMNGALKLCRQMEEDGITFNSMDEDRYLAYIAGSEAQGSRYLDIARDYLEFELDVLGKAVGSDLKEQRDTSGIPGVVRAIVLFLLCGGAVFLITGDSFSGGLLDSVCILLILSLLAVPVFFLRRRGRDAAADRYRKALFGIAALILACFVVLLIVSLLNARFHFWF